MIRIIGVIFLLFWGYVPVTFGQEERDASLHITSLPKAAILINGVPKGETPQKFEVSSNKEIEVLLIAKGFNRFYKTYTLKKGEEKHEDVELDALVGEIEIITEPEGAVIRVDGRQVLSESFEVQKTPATIKLNYGEHKIMLKKKGFAALSQTVVMDQEMMPKLRLQFSPSGKLIVWVPEKYKNSTIYLNGKRLGAMRGSISRTFEVNPGKEIEILAKHPTAKTLPQVLDLVIGEVNKVEFFEWENLASTFGTHLSSSSFSLKSRVGVTFDFDLFGVGFRYKNYSMTFLTGEATVNNEWHFYFRDNGTTYSADQITAEGGKALYSLFSGTWWKAGMGWLYMDVTMETYDHTKAQSLGRSSAFRLSCPIAELGFQLGGDSSGFEVFGGVFIPFAKGETLEAVAGYSVEIGYRF